VAETCGVFDENGLDVNILQFQAQMDCDTALQNGWANTIVTDLVRYKRMKSKGLPLECLTVTEASWQLLSNHAANIHKLKQLDDKMLAMTRFSATHLLSDYVVDSAKLKTERVFRIQINDLNIRLGMMQAGIMDALLLPEPQATAARNNHAVLLYDTHDNDIRLGIIAISKKAASNLQIEAFKKSYDMACDSINEKGLRHYAHLIEKYCNVHQQTIDSLPTIYYHHASSPRLKDLSRVDDWLKIQNETMSDEKQGISIP
jgi:NitT/TauT family transport system substrate-binding protein